MEENRVAAAGEGRRADRYPLAMRPLDIGRITVRNRIFSSAHGTGYALGGLLTDRHVEYHRARARGGIGLIVIEATAIDSSPLSLAGDRGSSLRNSGDEVLDGYRKLSAALHAEGTKVFCMLSHSGRNAVMGADGRPPVAPSAIPMDRTRDIPHALDLEEIARVIEDFASAARRCRDGGLDGVELSFTHGNLVQQFLSAASNKRDDIYGGSEDNRLRLAREVLQAARAAVGPDFTFGIRFAADELIPDGYRLEDGQRYIRHMVEWGQLDFVNVSAGTNSDMTSRSIHYPTITAPPCSLVDYAAAIRAVVDVPVFCIGKISTLAEAEAILATEKSDLVGMTRAHIAEPDIIRLSLAGEEARIRPCIYCNESCFGRSQRSIPITCIYNPASGRELMWPALPAASSRKNVVVVGGGPAGLEAARVLAETGHAVTLHEAGPRLGGQLLDLSIPESRRPYAEIAAWYSRELDRLGVTLHLNNRVGTAAVLEATPDAVVLATGAVDAFVDVPGAGLAHVISARQALREGTVEGPVVIVDYDSRFMAMSVAEHLASRRRAVTLVTPAFYVGMDAELLTWHPSYRRLLALGVAMRPMHKPVAITPDSIAIARLDGETETLPVASVVYCTRGRSERSLAPGLRGRVPVLRVVGDAWSPRQIEQAVYEGALAAREIATGFASPTAKVTS